ncbi:MULTISPECIES: LLM class flavin-dependent oxidoreductase [Acinetobacter]|jgi:Coenzyme F420-dependent N5,N10-methylene tetrahydromethanopterin reductase and related flavin-dependent oxidoreductases|uniref:5,10-methylene tetrahydromethanopterin reductase n=1 Tax=Acinetobacter baumannii TaxID=470 RepID=A0A1E3M5M8_ACIBA|nr:LLM class flavin-dependent oxidoreductase [Acinetobacter baumannii]AKQ27236.1 5,10-methylene tetrahydromethanopterin reductase [Acinetobacter baumannii]APP32005.1 5,10-methylene tetrahydromethanopterin reductase [Acinetobacter baumannii]APX50472.1 5,10-methylene tetrahydromethanopterin reductase [Acinetobacter baumannii]EHU1489185.1 LLM class flavin-dependent oxidoreductase [Acinetobacter baumannii]EHU1524287.1 LLM class flavin-dependent oxidoreductase [Acinetobacter baumannii]
MTKRISFNAFEMNCIAHQSPGLWRHPQDRSVEYKDLEYWTDLAQILEHGFFDGIFIADVLGIYDVYHQSAEHALTGAVQVPVNDPLQIVPAMAAVTKHLGFGVTTSISFEHPYPFARRISTLDHLTKGRVGWNIVTSYLESGSKNLGLKTQVNHDNRYDIADEYLEVLYKLWEGSWEEGSVLRDRESGIFADYKKVHPIQHEGKYFTVPGIHICEPSPQRTPVLYQAGASSRGQKFASQNAECVFIAAPSKIATKKVVQGIRQKLAQEGRDPYSVKIYALLSIVTDETDAKAQAKFKEYQSYGSYDGALTLLSGWSGVDFSQYQPTDKVEYIQTNAIQSLLDSYVNADPERVWTIEEIANWNSLGGNGPVLVGSAETVSDALQQWVEDTDIDGFNLAYILAHQTFADVVEFIVPELQKRGVYQTSYAQGTLREKLFGAGPYLPENHRGAKYRNLKELKLAEAS